MIQILGTAKRILVEFAQQRIPKDWFLEKVPGVIHIGANAGQERDRYASLGLNVLWIEPIPAVFETLLANIAPFPKQQALCRLLADQDGIEYDFHIANNEGASSSIFDLAEHTEIWPDIHYTHTIRLGATTLTHLVEAERIDLRKYGALVLDTQGSELLVLKGAAAILDRFKFVEAEVADFECYADCCQLADLTAFLRHYGFVLSRKTPFAQRKSGGTCYDALYRRVKTSRTQ